MKKKKNNYDFSKFDRVFSSIHITVRAMELVQRALPDPTLPMTLPHAAAGHVCANDGHFVMWRRFFFLSFVQINSRLVPAKCVEWMACQASWLPRGGDALWLDAIAAHWWTPLPDAGELHSYFFATFPSHIFFTTGHV